MYRYQPSRSSYIPPSHSHIPCQLLFPHSRYNRPIIDTCKSFAANVDIEDLGLNSFWHKDESKESKVNKLPFYDPNCQFSTFPEFLKDEVKFNTLLDSGKYSWHSPSTIAELQNLLQSVKASEEDRVKVIVSNTVVPEDGISHSSYRISLAEAFVFESLFADEFTRCTGERIAIIVADSQKHADIAATKVVVEYDTDNRDPPILTVEDAVKRSSFFDVPPFLYPKPVGDFTDGMAEADHKILYAEITLPSQYYFYLETQTALAIPDEDNCMLVYSSIQAPEYAHSVIAACLGVIGFITQNDIIKMLLKSQGLQWFDDISNSRLS